MGISWLVVSWAPKLELVRARLLAKACRGINVKQINIMERMKDLFFIAVQDFDLHRYLIRYGAPKLAVEFQDP